jgi:integrase
LAIRERLAHADPVNWAWQRNLSVSYNKFGDVQQAQGDLAAALASYKNSLAIAEHLTKIEQGNTLWQHDLSVSQNKIGSVHQAQGHLDDALNSYLASLAIAEGLTVVDPSNASWQRDLSISYERMGEVQQAQGNLTEALASYKASLGIREVLAKADLGNTVRQRDLSVSYNRIGDVYQAQGDIAGAMASYKASLAIRERLALADPGNAVWQRYLSISYTKIGDIRQTHGSLASALADYQAALAIAERLSNADPGNAVWHRDLARILSWALKRGLIDLNPCAEGGKLYSGSRVDKVWSDEQVVQFLKVTTPQMALAMRLAINTGQRQGDLRRLPWSAYDGTTIKIRQRKTGVPVPVPVSDELKAALDAAPRVSPIMLVNTDGKPWSESGFQSAWGKATARAGVEGLTFHDLRGTAVVHLARAGCNVIEIYSITGHKPGDVQAILTAHYLPQDGEVAANAIAKLNMYRRGRGDQKGDDFFPTGRPTVLKVIGLKGDKS